MNFIDFLILGIALLLMISSAKKGFLTLVIEIVGYVLALPVSLHYSKILAEPFYNQFVRDKLIEKLSTSLSQNLSADQIINTVNETVSKLPFSLSELGEKINYDIQGSLDSFVANINSGNYVQSLVDTVLKPVIIYICTGVLLLVLLLLILIVVKFFAKIIGKIKLPKFLRSTNNVFGAVIGLAKSVVIIVAFATIINVFTTVSNLDNKFIQASNQSKIVQFVNDNNAILNSIQK